VDRVELMPMLNQELQCISLVELERVAGLWVEVHTYHVEAGTAVAFTSSALAAKKVK
jgi:hypothetical protein